MSILERVRRKRESMRFADTRLQVTAMLARMAESPEYVAMFGREPYVSDVGPRRQSDGPGYIQTVSVASLNADKLAGRTFREPSLVSGFDVKMVDDGRGIRIEFYIAAERGFHRQVFAAGEAGKAVDCVQRAIAKHVSEVSARMTVKAMVAPVARAPAAPATRQPAAYGLADIDETLVLELDQAEAPESEMAFAPAMR